MADQQLIELITAALDAACTAGDLPACTTEVRLEQPPKPELGDFSCNIALALAKPAGKPPREVAQIIIDALPTCPAVERVEIAGPGFINFYLSPTWLQDTVREVLARGERYGHSDIGAGKRVQVEFVSAIRWARRTSATPAVAPTATRWPACVRVGYDVRAVPVMGRITSSACSGHRCRRGCVSCSACPRTCLKTATPASM